ncbi:MAG: pyridoxal-phosphate dependent enzyme [Planctomycetota bacterium]|nr:MAG: pyridoxal-phosphate dependent enzyme [Planctomycetota bacterium]
MNEAALLQRTPPAIRDSVLDAVGNTPLIRLPAGFDPQVRCEVLLKVELFNPGGSVKDRIGLRMVREAARRGDLKPGGVVVECTSGNTGVGLCMAAAALGYRTIMVMPDKMSQEKVDMLRAYGAEVVLTPTFVQPSDPRHYTHVAARIAKETPGGWLADQFHNLDNPTAHYLTTGPEIWEATGGRLDVYVGGCGTGGTVSGVSRYLKERDSSIRIVGVDPKGSVYEGYWRTGTLGEAGTYQVEGVGEDQIPGTWDPSLIDGYQIVEDAEAFHHARRLAAECGLFVGGSSGLALAGALREARQLAPDARVVVLLPDSGGRYLSKCFSDDWMKDNGFLPRVAAATATVGDLLRQRPRAAVTPQDTLTEALKHLGERGVRPLPVLDQEGGKLLGIVDEQELLDAVAARANLDQRKVADTIAPAPPQLKSEEPWQRLQDALRSHDAVLVRDARGWTGMDRRDLLRSLLRLQ